MGLLLAGSTLASLGATLTLGSDTVSTGGISVVLPVTLEHAASEAVAGMQFDVGYEDVPFEAVGATIGPAASTAGKTLQFAFVDETHARLIVSGFNLNTIPSGIVAYVTFQVMADAPQAVYVAELQNALLSSAYGASISVTSVAGAITVGNPVSSPADVNGDSRIDAKDVQLVINRALGLDISPFDADVSENGKVDAADVQMVINAVLGGK
ncbi:MAG: dockerin type I domain-containing protein [FCB group bacterium]|nr:dockerin type I domain-containing protein [FCB group bacterium]